MFNNQLIYVFFSLLAGFSSSNASANETNFLQNFKANPKVAIDKPVAKFGATIDQRSLDEKIDACRQLDSRDMIMKASGLRKKNNFTHSGQQAGLRSLVEEDSNIAKEFLELTDVFDDVKRLDTLRSAEIEVQPWSGDYWAIRSGITAKRYLDKNFPGSTAMNTWQEAFNYFIANPPAQVASELLAPSEKYDRLVGDKAYTLTNISWQEGKQYNDQYGDVEKWMGICHGWAPAAFMEPRPTQAVEFASYKATPDAAAEKITFLPDDLKALASLKWANGITVKRNDLTSGTRFIGGRCNSKDPKRDPDTGRIIDADCFDLNPGLWHIVVVNQIAREKRSFVIDANFDYEVWNQPVTSYRYTYFNPKTMQPVETLEEAQVQLDDRGFQDQFKKYRTNRKAVAVVGVRMHVSYTVETSPRGRDTDSTEHDAVRTAQYHYDLEIDKDGKIVGGEWYQNRHPDFIWMPTKDSTALNVEDLELENETQIVDVAPRASKSRAPLRLVIDKLMSAAHQ